MATPDTAHEEHARYGEAQVPLPRIAIKFCVQCKWNLRAAYYAQELLSTFSTALGEVSLIPATGGTFTITLLHGPPSLSPSKDSTTPTTTTTTTTGTPSGEHDPRPQIAEVVLWDRKVDGGFPETKELKNRVRNVVEPGRDLGHIDRSLKKSAAAEAPATVVARAETPTESSEGIVPRIESNSAGGGRPTNSTVQSDVVVRDDTGSTTQAEKCEDCH